MRRSILLLPILLFIACAPHGQSIPNQGSEVPGPRSPATISIPTLGPVYQFPNDVRLEGPIDPPELVRKVAPDVAEGWKARAAQGFGVFQVIVDEVGNVRDVRMLREPEFTPPWPEFEQRCRAALSEWKYRPAAHDGKPVAVYLTITVRYADKADDD
jgi:hypothetical protein